MAQSLEEPDSVPTRQEVEDWVEAAAQAHQRPPDLVGQADCCQELAVV